MDYYFMRELVHLILTIPVYLLIGVSIYFIAILVALMAYSSIVYLLAYIMVLRGSKRDQEILKRWIRVKLRKLNPLRRKP